MRDDEQGKVISVRVRYDARCAEFCDSRKFLTALLIVGQWTIAESDYYLLRASVEPRELLIW